PTTAPYTPSLPDALPILGRGVCGTAVAERRTQVVPDVHAFPGHIACDDRSRSEIVVPIVVGGEVVGVLDIDSPDVGTFDIEDRRDRKSTRLNSSHVKISY